MFGIGRVVIAENANFKGSEELLISRGVEVTVIDENEITLLLKDFISKNLALWKEDISEL